MLKYLVEKAAEQQCQGVKRLVSETALESPLYKHISLRIQAVCAGKCGAIAFVESIRSDGVVLLVSKGRSAVRY